MTSTGLGRDLCFAAIERGDKVIATTRAQSFDKLTDLKDHGIDVLVLDVTSSLDTLHKIAAQAVEIHGRVDVVVNNAGRSLTNSSKDVRLLMTVPRFCVLRFVRGDDVRSSCPNFLSFSLLLT